MKKLLSRVKRALSSGSSSRGSGSCAGDNRSQDSLRSSSFVPSPHGTTGSSRYHAHDDTLEATDGDDISIRTTEEMEKYESLRHREFAHTRIYDVNLLERVGSDEELPTILRTIGWGKTLRQGSFRWMSFTLFPMAELCSIATPELNLIALVGELIWRQCSRP
jgi:hypothetical protein